MIRIIDYKDIDRADILERKENVFNVADTVSEIINQVKTRGDKATRRFSNTVRNSTELSSIHLR